MSEQLRIGREASLAQYQDYAKAALVGQEPKITESMLILAEEAGWVSKSFRRELGLAYHLDSKFPSNEEALAGLLLITLHLANLAGIDLEKAFRERERKVKRRKNRFG